MPVYQGMERIGVPPVAAWAICAIAYLVAQAIGNTMEDVYVDVRERMKPKQ